MGESPALHISGSHHPALSENANQYKAAQSQLLTYLGYTNIFSVVMQALFSQLTNQNGCDMVTIRKEG